MASDPSTPSPVPDASTAQKDMSQYMRTYAKDVALLTNQPPPASPPKPSTAAAAPVATAPAPAPATDGVILPEIDESPVNRRGDVSPKDFPAEIVSLSKEDSEGIFADRTPPATTPPPIPVPAAPPPIPEPDTAAIEREAVLARLRQKLADRQQEPSAPPPVPMFPSRPEPVVEPNWQPPPAPMPAAPPPPTPTAPEAPRGPDPLHTYTSDFADHIDRERASTFSVLAAQQDAGQGKSPVAAPRRAWLPVTLAVLLIVIGSGGIYAAYRITNPGTSTPQTLGVPSLIFADEKIELEGPNYRQALADATNEPLVEGNILVTYTTSASSTTLINEPQPGGILIRALDLGAPDILLRNVDLLSTVGIVRAGNETHPFFILRVNSYERTFAGMLGWESRMLDDLAPLYPPYTDLAPFAEPLTVATSTATTTATSVPLPPPMPISAPVPTEFVDIIVANRDVRALKDRFGRTLILYGYSDRQTLIIARDEAAFTTLVARLAATAAETAGN